MNKKFICKKAVLSLLALGLLLGTAGCSASKGGEGNESETTAVSQAAGTAGEASEAAQDIDWPTRTIEIVVPASAGGGNDLHARLYARYLEELFDVPVIVSNMTTGGQAPAFRYVHDAEPDGYTILHTHDAFFINQANGSIDFGLEDMTNLGITSKIAGQILVANTKKGWNSLEDLVTAAKEKPDSVTVGISVGSTTQVMADMMIDAGIPVKAVDTSGASDRVAKLLGGHIDLAFMGYSDLEQYIQSGDFTPLCVIASEREAGYPDIPTAKESGYDVVFDSSYFMLTSPGTDQAVVDKLTAALAEISAIPEYAEEVDKIDKQAPLYITPEDSIDTLTANLENLKKYSIQ